MTVLNKSNETAVEELINMLEEIEAITTDKKVIDKITDYLIKNKIWPSR